MSQEIPDNLKPLISYIIEHKDEIENYLNNSIKYMKTESTTYTSTISNPTIIKYGKSKTCKKRFNRLGTIVAAIFSMFTSDNEINIESLINVDLSHTYNQYSISVQHKDNTLVSITSDNAAIHNDSKSDSQIIDTLSKNDKVQVITSENNWSLVVVIADNEIQLTGWVKNEYLDLLDE